MRFKVANYSRLEIRLDTLHIYNGYKIKSYLLRCVKPIVHTERVDALGVNGALDLYRLAGKGISDLADHLMQNSTARAPVCGSVNGIVYRTEILWICTSFNFNIRITTTEEATSVLLRTHV